MAIEEEKVLGMLIDLQRSIGKIEGMMNAHVAGVAAHMAATQATQTSIEKRLTKVEINQGKYSGIAAVVGGLLGWLSYHFWPFHT